MGNLSNLEEEATLLLITSESGRKTSPIFSALAPGRCTLVGDHVDYADGFVCGMAINLSIAAAVRASENKNWVIRSKQRFSVRNRLSWNSNSIADRPLAVVEVLRQRGIILPPLEIAFAASLPEGAGLSSSAALSAATLGAILRFSDYEMTPDEMVEITLSAERDILKIPVGTLDQKVIILSTAPGAVLLDCVSGQVQEIPWNIKNTTLVACFSGQAHNVGNGEYKKRRTEVTSALKLLDKPSWREVSSKTLESVILPEMLKRRARHIVSETQRAQEAAKCLVKGEAKALGELMNQSHYSLRDDFEVSTDKLNKIAQAAREVEDCLGARMVGAGFGGCCIALVKDSSKDVCKNAMLKAAGSNSQAWFLEPSPGFAIRNPDISNSN